MELGLLHFQCSETNFLSSAINSVEFNQIIELNLSGLNLIEFSRQIDNDFSHPTAYDDQLKAINLSSKWDNHIHFPLFFFCSLMIV